MLRYDPQTKRFEALTGKPAILILGDSFTWGAGVEANATFSAKLQTYFKNYHVVNAGLNGAGVMDMANIFIKNYSESNCIRYLIVVLLDQDIFRGDNFYYCDEYFDSLDYDKTLNNATKDLKIIFGHPSIKDTRKILMLWPADVHHSRYFHLAHELKKWTETYNNATMINDFHRYLALAPPKDRYVSNNDHHPNEYTHNIATQRLLMEIKKFEP